MDVSVLFPFFLKLRGKEVFGAPRAKLGFTELFLQ